MLTLCTLLNAACASSDGPLSTLPPLMQPTALVDNAAWVIAQTSEDPFDRTDAVVCPPQRLMSETEFSGRWFIIETLGCDHATVQTPLLSDVPKGARMVARFFHFTINVGPGEGGWALRLAIAGEKVAEHMEPSPAPTRLIDVRWTATRDYLAGESVTWNVGNHGINGWSLIDVTALGPFEGCPIATDACASSADCANYGRCALDGATCTCVVKAGACRDSGLCIGYGLCAASQDQCVAAADADCMASKHCPLEGYCTASDGECIAATAADCEAAGVCKQLGQCHAIGHGCAAESDADCLAAESCRFGGLCSMQYGRCAALSDADCAQSDYCDERGECFSHNGICTSERAAK